MIVELAEISNNTQIASCKDEIARLEALNKKHQRWVQKELRRKKTPRRH